MFIFGGKFGYGCIPSNNLPHSIKVMNIKSSGLGCPDQTFSIIINCPFYEEHSLIVGYKDLTAKLGSTLKGGENSIKCNLQVSLDLGNWYQFRIRDIEQDGYHLIQENVTGKIKAKINHSYIEEQILEVDIVTPTINLDYVYGIKFPEKGQKWSPCIKDINIEIDSMALLEGNRKKDSIITVDRDSGLVTQRLTMGRKKCID